MSRVSFGLGVLALVAVGGFVAGPVGVAQEPRAQAEQPFTSQYVTVIKKSNPACSIDLEKVRVQKLEGRSFLVGTGSDTPDNWQKGKTVWVALDDVSEMTTFASLDEMRKAGIIQDLAPKADGQPKRDGQE